MSSFVLWLPTSDAILSEMLKPEDLKSENTEMLR